MSVCSRCGNPVEFRYVGGRCIPLHLNGGCNSAGGSTTDYSGFNVSHESTCFCTNCPKCGEEVFFIRHNGGSVWIDPPLGPPWTKHACFDTSTSKQNLLTHYKISIDSTVKNWDKQLIIGIVKSTSVDFLKRYTDIQFETGKQDTKNIRLKHNAGFLLGKLCIFDKANAVIWPIEEPSYVFAMY